MRESCTKCWRDSGLTRSQALCSAAAMRPNTCRQIRGVISGRPGLGVSRPSLHDTTKTGRRERGLYTATPPVASAPWINETTRNSAFECRKKTALCTTTCRCGSRNVHADATGSSTGELLPVPPVRLTIIFILLFVYLCPLVFSGRTCDRDAH